MTSILEDDPLAAFFQEDPAEALVGKAAGGEKLDDFAPNRAKAKDAHHRGRGGRGVLKPPSSQNRRRGRSASTSRSRSKSKSKPSRPRSRSPRRLIEDFIKENELDARVAGALRSISESQAKCVILDGFHVLHCKNPSAVVMSRIRKVEGGKALSGNRRVAAANPRRDVVREPQRGGARERSGRRRRRRRSHGGGKAGRKPTRNDSRSYSASSSDSRSRS